MKHIIYLLAVYALAQPLGAQNATPLPVAPEVATEVKNLLLRLPTQSQLWNCHRIVNEGRNDLAPAQIESARATVQAAHEIAPKVRQLLKLGASVFDYPGLLAHGEITFPEGWSDGDPFVEGVKEELGYRLRVGLPTRLHFGHEFEFVVVFDSRGVIRKIGDVHGKE